MKVWSQKDTTSEWNLDAIIPIYDLINDWVVSNDVSRRAIIIFERSCQAMNR